MKMQGSIEFAFVERSEQRVVSEMPIAPGILNPFGVVHAGAILWFADVTATVLAMNPDRPPDSMQGFPLAINLNANFLANQKEGSIKAVATFVKRGKTVCVVRTVVTGTNDKVIADVTTNHVFSK